VGYCERTQAMKKIKHRFKFEVSFNLDTYKEEKLDRYSIKQFETALYDYVNNYAGECGTFYVYTKAYDDEVYPTNLKVKKLKQ
jgi:hypothetical protein